jgi:RNA polymerase sigma-70 factor (ECF subfamily)
MARDPNEPAPLSPGDVAAAGEGDRAALRRVRQALRSLGPADREAVAELVDPVARAAAAGSPAALELLVWAVDELGLARPAIRQLLVDDADVDEVAQDVLVAVAETVRGFRGESRFTTWLHQVARFKAIAHLRRRAPAPVADPAAAEGGGPEPLGDAQRISSMIATRASIGEVLRDLPDEYREPVVLRDVEQLSYEELSSRLGLNPNTAKTRVARGRALVAARLAR